ncbi:AmmeMemoRadiSam system radical SAM enzyme [Caloramator sp. CAR-1]|uniref:AmmeMemoRadiSam system radical SAM enzyme n=1 Tax=Caloramator sp. CAR-1 TaxID=3062777 RepID=UPI0026E48327|nr:AmmeMemoRadiSam system radical SAM enzyme [Caloramator sp. CAR-1]MDO6353756.1 AmmeMemoRadiSam system radical SAM enzyme [Caloramator sp. CAR-1]
MKEAQFYNKIEDLVYCNLCPHGCKLSEGQTGLCRVRKVIDGKLYSLNYGKISAINLDPIEKKPLYHYKPGSLILSVGSVGCNFSCGFCQNYTISQTAETFFTTFISPEELISIALKYKEKGNIGIAFTYNEPLIFYEYIYDTITLLKDELDIILVSNGYVNEAPLKDIIKHVKAINFDLKAYNEDFYKRICHGSLEPVLNSIKIAYNYTHVEITTLIIPGFNDSEEEIDKLSLWISKLSPNIPLHLTRYFPNYKFQIEATPIETLVRLQRIAKKHLNFVYLGNVLLPSNTVCPNCNKILIKRNGFEVQSFMTSNQCPFCSFEIEYIKI